ncbi:MAG: nuclear transport factor 2 family protein [Marmoricola sp.]
MLHTVESLTSAAESWDRAIQQRDQTMAGDILAEDFALVLVHPAPASMPRERWLEVLPDYVVRVWEVEERVIDLTGDLGVVLQRVRMEATVLGEDRSGLFVLSDVWRWQQERWRVWRRHSSPLSAGRMPGTSA